MLLNHSPRGTAEEAVHVGFNANCTIMPTKKQLKATQGKAKPQIKNRCAVLFRIVNKERVD